MGKISLSDGLLYLLIHIKRW